MAVTAASAENHNEITIYRYKVIGVFVQPGPFTLTNAGVPVTYSHEDVYNMFHDIEVFIRDTSGMHRTTWTGSDYVAVASVQADELY